MLLLTSICEKLLTHNYQVKTKNIRSSFLFLQFCWQIKNFSELFYRFSELATKACQKGVGNLTRLTSVLEQCVKELIDILKNKLKESERDVLVVSCLCTARNFEVGRLLTTSIDTCCYEEYV